MLQQTTVKAVAPYFARFTARWPDVAALAADPLEDVLKLWAGLGYYARARNLHACAQAVVAHHGGRFPATEADLAALPGIGPYTAAAIAAIAFGACAAAVDGNVERVVARLFAVAEELPAAKPERGTSPAAQPSVTATATRPAVPEHPRPPADSSPSISGPSFLGLNDEPPPRRRSDLSVDTHRSGARNLNYLLDDEEEHRGGGGAGKFFLIVLALLLAVGFGYLRWKNQLPWLNAGANKPTPAAQTPDQSPADSSAPASPSVTPEAQPAPNPASNSPSANTSPGTQPGGNAPAQDNPTSTQTTTSTTTTTTPNSTTQTTTTYSTQDFVAHRFSVNDQIFLMNLTAAIVTLLAVYRAGTAAARLIDEG